MNEHMLQLLQGLAIITVSVVIYALILRRMAFVVQPVRLKMAELGEHILSSDLPAARADQIRFYLDNAFNGWVMFFVALVLPLVAVFMPFYMMAKRQTQELHQQNSDEQRVAELFGISAFAANPLFGAVVAVEFAVLGFLLLLFVGPQLVADMLRMLITLERGVQSRLSRLSGPAVVH